MNKIYKMIMITIIGIIMLSTIGNAIPYEEWNKTYGNILSNSGATSVIQTSDEGYVTIGRSNSNTAFILKTYKNGTVNWKRLYPPDGNGGSKTFNSVKQTTDGGYIIAGDCCNIGADNVFLLKTYSNGNLQWKKTLASGGFQFMVFSKYAQQTTDGGYILIGTTDLQDAEGDPHYSYTWIIKTNANGDGSWSKSFSERRANTGQQTKDGGYILIGSTANFDSNSLLVKTNSLGNEQWNKTFTGISDLINGQQTSDGGYIVIGQTTTGRQLIKTDIYGNKQWSKTFGTTYIYSVQQTKDGGYIIAGNNVIIKTDANGNIMWQKTLGGALAMSVQQTKDGGYIVTGSKNSYAWLAKYGDKNIGINVISPNGEENWIVGTTKTIVWSSIGSSGSYVKIDLYKAGIYKQTIVSSTPNDGSHNWYIPTGQTLGSDYKIKVTSTSNPTYTDMSDNNFIISSAVYVNLLKNPGFEESYNYLPRYWTKQQTGTKAIFTYPEIGRTGTGKSVAIKYLTRETGKVALWRQDNIPITPYKQYKLSGYMKLQGVTGSSATPRPGGASIRVTWFNSNGAIIRTDVINKIGTIGWTRYEKIVTAPSNAVKAMVGGDLFDSAGKVLFDDLSFVKI